MQFGLLLGVKAKTTEDKAGRFEAAARGLPEKSLILNQKGERALEVCTKEKKQLVQTSGSQRC